MTGVYCNQVKNESLRTGRSFLDSSRRETFSFVESSGKLGSQLFSVYFWEKRRPLYLGKELLARGRGCLHEARAVACGDGKLPVGCGAGADGSRCVQSPTPTCRCGMDSARWCRLCMHAGLTAEIERVAAEKLVLRRAGCSDELNVPRCLLVLPILQGLGAECIECSVQLSGTCIGAQWALHEMCTACDARARYAWDLRLSRRAGYCGTRSPVGNAIAVPCDARVLSSLLCLNSAQSRAL